MRLADFIESNADAILGRWDDYASSLLPESRHLEAHVLRDHGAEILAAVVQDLRTDQSRAQQHRKSLGHAPAAACETAAQSHAVLRATNGFSIRHLVSEYRALRASVLRQWLDCEPVGAETLDDMVRFNEAIDQAVTESVDFFTSLVERWRSLFLGAVGHDLRTPLHSIVMTAEMISQQSPTMEVRRHIERLVRSGQRMGELLDDLLDYNRVSLGGRLKVAPRWGDLARIAADELQILQAAHPDTEIFLSVTGTCTGMWDPSRMRQMLSNLVDNGVKYGDGREVTVALRAREDSVELSVTNAGPEIDPEDLGAIFDPLTRRRTAEGDDERRHLGLGLFIARQAVEAHGGRIAVESSAGRTTFTATLPRRSEPDPSA